MPFCVNCGAQVAGAFCTKCGARAGAASTPAAAAAPVSGPPAPPLASPASAAPAAPAAPLAPRKTSPIVWILLAVVGLFVLGGIAVVGTGLFLVHKVRESGLDPELMRTKPGLAMAKLLAATNPDVEVVTVDDAKGTITLRQKSTGKTTTMDFDQAKNGRFSFSGDGGSVTIGANQGTLPAWLPAYPNSNPRTNFSASGAQGSSASFTFETKDRPQDVVAFYQDGLRKQGFHITATSTSQNGQYLNGLVSAEDETNRRTVVMTARSNSSGSSGTTVSVTYAQK